MNAQQSDHATTTQRVRAARQGDVASISWLVQRLSPWLRMQARYRLRGALRRLYEPDDLVHDVWANALQRLPTLRSAADGRHTPVLLRYLARALLLRVKDLLERHLRAHGEPLPLATSVAGTPVDEALLVAIRTEQSAALRGAIDALSASDREVLVLRGLERLPIGTVAQLLGVSKDAACARFRRAKDNLRTMLGARGEPS